MTTTTQQTQTLPSEALPPAVLATVEGMTQQLAGDGVSVHWHAGCVVLHGPMCGTYGTQRARTGQDASDLSHLVRVWRALIGEG